MVATAVPSVEMVGTLVVTEISATPVFCVPPPPPPEEQVAKLPQLPLPPQLPSATNATEANTHLKIRMCIT
jgi:hypothetical protein